MNSEKNKKLKYKHIFYSLLCTVEDETKQKQVISLLKKYEEKIPDSKLKTLLERLFRKNKGYEELCDSYVKDLFEGKINAETNAVLTDLLKDLKALIEDEPKSWWDMFIEWFKNGTGTK